MFSTFAGVWKFRWSWKILTEVRVLEWYWEVVAGIGNFKIKNIKWTYIDFLNSIDLFNFKSSFLSELKVFQLQQPFSNFTWFFGFQLHLFLSQYICAFHIRLPRKSENCFSKTSKRKSKSLNVLNHQVKMIHT